jgi:uncharacterized protein (DUF488 family)
MAGMRIVTIGVYGYTAEAFFSALESAGVDIFCDIRWRRGVRGSDYAFANHKRLQARLESLEIEYVHRRDLAPAPEVRKRQADADKTEGIAKRKRNELSSGFKEAYRQEVLIHFNAEDFIESLGGGEKVIALCCVERQPEACHRSLLAAEIQEQIGAPVEHLMPA